jgi:NitT/TauT family transport system ATP-binding protein
MFPYRLEQTVLSLSNVSLTLDGRPVLDKLCGTIRNVVRPGMSQGQLVAILGPSGIGKTQLFRILAGLRTPDSGQVLLGPEQQPVRAGQVGVVLQNYPLFEHRSVLDNLLVAGRAAGLSRREAAERAKALLDRFELRSHSPCYPAQLSGGQRQRAAIAQQLLCKTQLLLMDEPFSGLDPLMVRAVCRLLSEVAQTDELFTTVVVTHDIDAAISMADTLWLMGRTRGENGARGGARIAHEFDLKERGLAWEPNVRALPAFAETRREVEQRFAQL